MNEEEYIGQKIVNLARQLGRKMSNDVAQYGITNMQAKIINFLYKESPKRVIFQRDIEERFEIRRSSVTSVLNLMESNNLIERITAEEDRRLKKIVLKEKGLELYSAVFQHFEDLENSLSDALTGDEKKLLLNVIDKLSKKIDD